MKIIHLKHHDIDTIRWNALLDSIPFVHPYAYSWYLDAVVPEWEALVYEDYTYVMPLPVKHKYGIAYLIQPRFVQQLGVFSAEPIDSNILHSFLKAIPYISYDMNLNYTNKGKFQELPNAIIPLQDSIDVIRSCFSSNTHRNIRKAENEGLQVVQIQRAEFLEKWMEINSESALELRQKLPLLCKAAQEKGCAYFFGAINEKGELLAVLFMVRSSQRLVYLAPASTTEGKECSAMFLLVDHILEHFSHSDLVFDCEGSQLPGVARFYDGFGAIAQPYYTVNRCRPQWLVRLNHR